MKNESLFTIEIDIMKCKILRARSLNKVSISSYKSKNVTILGWLKFLAISVGENAANLEQPETFEIKYIEFFN